ncbi:hypothetical protein TELCIR_12829 [Teladorsagia circumcincta]|uniref:Uncharacterized protein n=1 Tax=Teladorsagia circumcincta TaxID=45464 RepID=A0A2G9U5G4_TELCI|nr:hypothetical protein TELCIR_12829 [Teladorsagia circumcincta]
MLELDKVGLLHAQDVYNECKQCRKTICKSHYNEAASYIADAVAVMCENAGRDFFSAPGLIEIEVVTRLEPHRVAIDSDIVNSSALDAIRNFPMDIQSTSIASAENQVVHKSADSSNLPVLIEKDEPVAVQPHSGVKPRIPGGLAAFHKTRKGKEPPNMVPSSSGVCSDSVLKLDETDPKLLDEVSKRSAPTTKTAWSVVPMRLAKDP